MNKDNQKHQDSAADYEVSPDKSKTSVKLQRIGKYVIRKIYASTDYSTIYRCRNKTTDEDVAVKVFDLSPEKSSRLKKYDDQHWQRRFIAEAKAMACLDNPHIVAIKEQSRLEDGTPYFVMPFIKYNLIDELGKDVITSDAVNNLPDKYRPKTLRPCRVVSILRQLLDALAAIHKQGFVHRDIKPGNILSTAKREGNISLCDFGICQVPDWKHSKTGVWLGTLDYISPEQRENSKNVDALADIFSAGALAYRMLTGKLPAGAFASPHALMPDIPVPLSDLVMQSLAPDKKNRPQTAKKTLERLKDIFPPDNPDSMEPVLSASAFKRSAEALGVFREIFSQLPTLLGGKWNYLSLFGLAFKGIGLYAAQQQPPPCHYKDKRELTQAYLALGNVLERQGKTTEASIVNKQAISVAPECLGKHCGIAGCES